MRMKGFCRLSGRFIQGVCVAIAFLPALAGRSATITWVGGSGDWNTATNWSGSAVPNTNDDAIINPAGSVNITHSNGTNTVHSVQCSQPFMMSAGLLAVTTSFTTTNTFSLFGGTLKNATMVDTNGGSVVVLSGAFDGVTLVGTAEVG